jgi:hypothetical protein
MRVAKRFQEFKAVQRESAQVLAVLRRALFSVPRASSPVQGGPAKPPSPRLAWAIRTNTTRTYYLGADNVTDRRNSTLRCYFRHCG